METDLSQSSKIPEPSHPQQGSFLMYSILFLVLIGLDQISKYFFFNKNLGFFLNNFRPIVQYYPYRNYQFAFSWPLPVWSIYLVYAVVLVLIVRYLAEHYRQLGKISVTAWTFILAGAVSNISERLLLGYVRDFIYILTGIFNLADLSILLGIAILLCLQIRRR